MGRRRRKRMLENIARLERELGVGVPGVGVPEVPVPKLGSPVQRRRYDWLEERGGLVLGRAAAQPPPASCLVPQGFVVNELNGMGAGFRPGALIRLAHHDDVKAFHLGRGTYGSAAHAKDRHEALLHYGRP